MKKFLLLPLAMIFFSMSFGQTVTTYIGQDASGANGSSLDGTSLADFSFFSPYGIAIDKKGNMYVGDNLGNYIYVFHKGLSYARAGSGSTQGFTNGSGVGGTGGGTAGNTGMVADANNNIYFIDYLNSAVRRISAFISTGKNSYDTIIAGMGSNAPTTYPNYRDTIGAYAVFSYPTGLAIDSQGKYLYVADQGNSAIRKISLTDGKFTVSTVVGHPGPSGYGAVQSTGISGDVDGALSDAYFSNPGALTITASGNIYVADGSGNGIREIANGKVSTLANTQGANAFQVAYSPNSILRSNSGIIYVAVGCQIVKYASGGTLSTFAGDPNGSCSLKNASGTSARFQSVAQMAFNAAQDTIFVVDSGNYVVRAISVGTATGIQNLPVVQNISLYPNPANNNITITGQDGEATVSIFDVTGREMMQKQVNFNGSGYELPIENLPAGYYSIKIQNANQISAGKFMVVR